MKINERFPSELLQILTHFYRGEVQRSTDWRKRLDTTTNWAILAMTAAFSWGFGSFEAGQGSHVLFFFTSLIVFLLMSIEARRYRHFDVWRTRVRMLEVHLLMPSLNPELDIVQGDWREVLSNDLLLPSFKISFWEAAANRLRANYIWIYLGLLLGWFVKVWSVAPRGADGSLALLEFYQACGYGYADDFPRAAIPPAVVLGAYGVFWAVLIVLFVTTWNERRVTGEIRRRDRKARQWPI